MKSQVDKIFYFKKYKLMSRIVKLLYFERSKGDCVFNIDMRRSILVHNNDTRDYDKRSFSNRESFFYKYNHLTRN